MKQIGASALYFAALLLNVHARSQCKDEEESALLQVRQNRSSKRAASPTCFFPADAVYVDHLQNLGDECFESCGMQSGYCDFCGTGNVCCKPNGEGDSGCQLDVCKLTADWENSLHQRRRHHYCGSETNHNSTLTPEEAAILPRVTTQDYEAYHETELRLNAGIAGYHVIGKTGDLLDYFDFIPRVDGYTAQFKLPEGDYQLTSCNLTQVEEILEDHSQLDLIGAGNSYYIKKTEPESPSINMEGCTCMDYNPTDMTVTACAASTFGDAFMELAQVGRKMITHGDYHHLSFGGALAVFNHGSNDKNNSLVDTVNWVELYDLKEKRYQRVSSLQHFKQLIADRNFVMTRANLKTEVDPWVLSLATSSKGTNILDENFLASLKEVRSLEWFQRYEADGSYVTEVFGYNALSDAEVDVIVKSRIHPHACAERYSDCRFLDFFQGDGVNDSDSIFGYSFNLNGHVVHASEIEFWWAHEDKFGNRFWGQHFGPTRGTARSWEFELLVEGNLSSTARLWHAGFVDWPEDEREVHTVVLRRGKCLDAKQCWTWVGFYYHGHEEGFKALWSQAMEVWEDSEIFVHPGKERVDEPAPAKEVFMV